MIIEGTRIQAGDFMMEAIVGFELLEVNAQALEKARVVVNVNAAAVSVISLPLARYWNNRETLSGSCFMQKRQSS